MEINFCDNCNNLMDIYSDEDSSKLYLGCKCCSSKKDFDDKNKCIYTNESTIELSDIINTNKFLTEDVTLPIIKDNPNISCPNEECISNKEKYTNSEIIYIKYDSEKLSYMYICKHCQQKWTNR